MKRLIRTAVVCSALLQFACTSTDPCDRIVEMKEQARRCDMMRRNMDKLKTNPQLYSAAKQRYEAECVDFLYYQDDFSNEELKCLSSEEKRELRSRSQQP
ncbi:hypothetical protein [Gallaecimonas xiamenensis]|uniref:Uncharacterized protein n=1 Tax=Gallaecimonas xiamenensis 3-C-1 TaxID=745411 RepID=K2ILG6_9GAMM|nr:hypothetical protein [Gallaecimonas xiamenensis]EKE70986.1 hypothetical protein B3C1_13359 [Gallaecimonas xiamenensis 3-C-1]